MPYVRTVRTASGATAVQIVYSSQAIDHIHGLEPPAPDEGAWTYDVRMSPQEIVSDIVARVTRADRAST